MTRPLDIVPTLARALVCATVALSLPACGNYSNEDLEYMSAIPQRDDVAIEVPRRGTLVAGGAAEVAGIAGVTGSVEAGAAAGFGSPSRLVASSSRRIQS